MSAAKRTHADELGLLKLARDGDEDAFGDLVEAHRAELRAYCYRMLGSLHDAEDALQDAMLRAWRGLSGFEGRSSVRSWLYTIATNTALDIARHRSRRELPVTFGPPAPLGSELEAAVNEPVWLEAYPDRWLTGQADAPPEARYEQRESVELAFIVALQQMPPLQRAVLILRDVVGFSPGEISSQLGTSAASVNSALQRARASARRGLPERSQQTALRALGDRRTRELVRRYTDAMERGDAGTLVTMLTEDATWSMPPIPTWYRGLPAIREWLVRDPLTVGWKHRPAQANGQLAAGCYLLDPDHHVYVPAVIDVLTLAGGKISAVTGFLTAEGQGPGLEDRLAAGAQFFARFGLPPQPS